MDVINAYLTKREAIAARKDRKIISEEDARADDTSSPRSGRQRYRAVVLASGNGTNFQTVIDAVRDGRLPLDMVGLIVNRANAYAIRRAESAGIPVRVVFTKITEEITLPRFALV